MNIQKTKEFKKTIEKTYKNCNPLYIQSGKEMIPFFLVKSKIFGNRIINLPFLDVGVVPKKISKKDVQKILEKLGGKGVIEIRGDKSFENYEKIRKTFLAEGFIEEKEKYQMVCKIEDTKKMWKNFHKHTRNDIRKAEKSGLKIRQINSKKELEKFYSLYFREMKNFGTPQHSKRFFVNLMEEFKEKFFGLNCYKNGKLIASIIMIYSGKEGYLWFNVSESGYREYRPNDLLYWEMIKFAKKKKLNKIYLGQVDLESDNPKAKGLYKFKSKWNSYPVERIYFYHGIKEQGKQGGKKDKLKRFRKIWKKIPSPILKKLGPKIASQLGI